MFLPEKLFYSEKECHFSFLRDSLLHTDLWFDYGNVNVQKIKPENQRWQFALTILIYLLDLMQSLLNLRIVQNKKCNAEKEYTVSI
ncbi:hypothetical protein T08_1088 [Trichinella sp. T8]|nr:hypothetical protein T08_1088 [Trichinella sp. T8]